MRNHKGKTVQDRFAEGINYIEGIDDTELKRSFVIKMLGAVDLAVEFNMITYREWEYYVKKIFYIA